jgi:peroxiredoxin
MPHLVQMHQKLGSQGFVGVTVSVDDLKQKEVNYFQLALDFLKEKKVAMPNYILDEEMELWQKKLNSDAVPIVYVFNREGRIAGKFTEVKDKAPLDKLVEELLKEK